MGIYGVIKLCPGSYNISSSPTWIHGASDIVAVTVLREDTVRRAIGSTLGNKQ